MDGELDPSRLEAWDGDTTASDFVPREHGLWHIQHCFNYIRNGIQCVADTTIEIPTTFNGHEIFAGWNTTHLCRNNDLIYDYVLEHSSLPE